MRDFSATDAAFEGFRLTREHPRAILFWAAAHLVISTAMNAAMISIFGDQLGVLESVATTRDTGQAFATMSKLLPLYLLIIPYGLILLAIFPAAVFRMVLRPADKGLGFLKLGDDELRLIALALIYAALASAAVFLVVLGAGIGAALASVVAGPAMGLIGVLIGFSAVGLLVYLAVRLSLAGPMSFAQKRICVFDSWALTRGRFWAMFGAYLLAGVMAMIVLILAFLVTVGIAAAISGDGFAKAAAAAAKPQILTVADLFTPVALIASVLASITQALYYAVAFAPAAVIYRDVAHHTTPAEVFA